MILQQLCSYYDRQESCPDSILPQTGFSREKIHAEVVLNNYGDMVAFNDLRIQTKKGMIPSEMIVPQGEKRSGSKAYEKPHFLWDTTAFVFGADLNNDKNTPLKWDAFKRLHKKVMKQHPESQLKALCHFLEKWTPSDSINLPNWSELAGGNVVFRLDGELEHFQDKEDLRHIWLELYDHTGKTITGFCLISGEKTSIAMLHPDIKGVDYAQPKGASIVSFNADAYESYGKIQNYNAPISKMKAFQYTTALNHLLRKGSSNRIRIGDATTVFWTERDSPVEDFFGLILDPHDSLGDDQELAIFLESVREGKFPQDLDPDIRFYILGLSPNAARLSVRFWHASTVKDISYKLGQHFRDLMMVRAFNSEPQYPGMWHLLRETANQKSKDGPPPLLAGAVMQSILNGTPYPQALLSAVIGRIRADQNISYMRAAIIKAVLMRKKRILNQGMEVAVSLDKENRNVAYLLGRLFAVLEKAQQDAIPGANATIKDRFYGSASATPRIVFPQLLRLAQHHIEKSEYGRARDRQIEEILGHIKEFPAHMALDQQGMFAIGYYHQRQDFYTKKENPQA